MSATNNPLALTAADLVVGGWYCAKRYRDSRYYDRRIIWMGALDTGEHRELQYDSDTVANGRHFPKTTVGKFLRWASHRINSDGTPYIADALLSTRKEGSE